MKKLLKWTGIVLAGVAGLAMVKFGLPLLFAVMMVKGLECEYNALDDDAESALRETGLTVCAEYATWNDLSIGGTLTAFELKEYDYGDDVHVRDMAMAQAATQAGWHVKPVTAGEYAALLNDILPEAAFLQVAADLVFDAQYVGSTGNDPAALAFLDQDSGLMICLRTDRQPHAGSVRANGLTVPHNGFVYEMETHGGFHGDGSTYYALIVPESQRPALEKAFAAHADWHEGVITSTESRVMHDELFFQMPSLYPSEDVAFEWYCFVDTYARMYPEKASPTTPDARFPAVMQDAGACWSMNWLCALYDPDTGLFIYYEFDS